MEGGKRFLTFLLVAVLALGFGFGGGMLANGYTLSKTAQTNTAQNANNTVNTASNVVDASKNGSDTAPATQPVVINVSDGATVGEAIAEKVLPSVVGIDVIYETSYSGGWGYFFPGQGRNIEAEAQGTGFVVDAAGSI